MMRLLGIMLFVACQPLSDHTGELAGHRDGKRVYFKMSLGDTGVKQAVTGIDKKMPTKIHALSYARHEAKNLQLIDDKVNFGLINLSNVIFSWHYDKSATPVYTCHLHTDTQKSLSLGEQRDIIAKNSNDAPSCFVQKVAASSSTQDEQETDSDYVHLLAQHCVNLSDDKGSRFIFLEGKDFACDLSDNDDQSIVLQASCLEKDNSSCIDGKVRACATETGFDESFIASFKERVKTTMTCNDNGTNCTIKYELKEIIAESEAAENDTQAAETSDKTICAALAEQASQQQEATETSPEEESNANEEED